VSPAAAPPNIGSPSEPISVKRRVSIPASGGFPPNPSPASSSPIYWPPASEAASVRIECSMRETAACARSRALFSSSAR
jgi:hypothetical protein